MSPEARQGRNQKRIHDRAKDQERFEIEVTGLTKRVQEGHLQHIFSFYGESLQKVKKHPRDWSRALISYAEKEDAFFAYDMLSQSHDSPDTTIIDGQQIYLKMLNDSRFQHRRSPSDRAP